MFNYPVIVIGHPRSGTTTTARVLQEWFGVQMDTAPLKPNETINKYGWLEDGRLVYANTQLATKQIDIKKWTSLFRRFIRIREKQSPTWGFKDPRIVPLLGYALRFFKTPTIIRCCRPKELVVKSCVDRLKWTEEKSNESYDKFDQILNRVLYNRVHYLIDFKGEVKEDTIINMFSDTNILRYAS